jgi:hypothetical protein
MKNRKLAFSVAGTAIVLTAAVAFAAGLLYLPTDPVTVHHYNWPNGSNGTLDIELSDVGPGFDVTNGTYPGWCVENNGEEDYNGPGVTLLDSTDTMNLACGTKDYPSYPWGSINYLLNHQQGSIKEVQVAMWLLIGPWNGAFGPAVDPNKVDDMVSAAQANSSFVPGEGQVVAVILCADGVAEDPYQGTIIEVEVPRRGGQGCTPGYWKQEQHFFAWEPTGYYQNDIYGYVFPFDGTEFDWDHVTEMTLLEALWTGGGKEKALYRHATAGLLNAASPDVAYAYTVDEVLQMVEDAYESGDFNFYKDMLDEANNMGCPLDNGRHEEVEQDEAPHGGQNPHAEQNPQQEQVPHAEQNPQEEEEIQQESENPNTVRRGKRH